MEITFWREYHRSGECACTAYVTFKDAYSQDTACLLSVSNSFHFITRLKVVEFAVCLKLLNFVI